jgi:hypothetical protein
LVGGFTRQRLRNQPPFGGVDKACSRGHLSVKDPRVQGDPLDDLVEFAPLGEVNVVEQKADPNGAA